MLQAPTLEWKFQNWQRTLPRYVLDLEFSTAAMWRAVIQVSVFLIFFVDILSYHFVLFHQFENDYTYLHVQKWSSEKYLFILSF